MKKDRLAPSINSSFRYSSAIFISREFLVSNEDIDIIYTLIDEVSSTSFQPTGDYLNIQQLLTRLHIRRFYVISEEYVVHNQEIKVTLIMTD
jgi:hypothetical protein